MNFAIHSVRFLIFVECMSVLSRSSMTYESETRALLADVGLKFEKQRCSYE